MRRSFAHLLTMFSLLLMFPPVTLAQEWEKVIDLAKREGKVALIGPTGSDRRDAMVNPFQQKYGITVEYFSERGPGIGPRLSAERGAGLYSWDLVVTGTTTALNSLIPAGMLDPIEPALILPDVKDPKRWRGGEHEYIDPGRRLFVMAQSLFATLFINPGVVKPGEIKSYKDLLQPKWKGKLVTDDPTRAGPGLATFTFFYLHPDLGPNYIRALAKQELVMMRDYTQQLDAIVKEKYSVLIGVSEPTADEWTRKGLPVTFVDPRQLKEGTGLSASSSGLGLFNKAPHPNAARVYINWLLSKEGQTAFAQASGYISSRLDVPTDHAAWRVPIPGAIKTYTVEATTTIKDKVLAVLKDSFGSR